MATSTNNSTRPHAFNPPTVPPPPPTYKQVAITPLLPQAKLVTLAGQVGADPDTGSMAKDFTSQVRTAYANVANCLAAAGATPRDIVHVKHYVVVDSPGGAGVEVINRGWAPLWTEFMDQHADGHRPPDTVLGVAALAKQDIWYEVEVLAVVNA